jgi:hypothetical protein
MIAVVGPITSLALAGVSDVAWWLTVGVASPWT